MRRRQFLRLGTGALALAGAQRHAPAFADAPPLRVGLIGAGWYGKSALFRLLQVAPAEVVSLCDVDARMLEDAAARVAERQASRKRPRTYGDYRRLLAERDVDAVIVSTPDHWHALPTIEAVRVGVDVYVEKPVSVDVVEAQAMVAAARRHGRVVQVNTQRRSTPHLVEARDAIVRAGRLGKVGLVEIYSYYPAEFDRNPPDVAPPPSLDWETWTGPAPLRPYNKIVHPVGAGAPSWPTATGSSATWASTCSTWSAGFSASACRGESAAPGCASSLRRRSTSPTRRPRCSTTAISRSSGRTARSAGRRIRGTRGAPRSTARRRRSRRA